MNDDAGDDNVDDDIAEGERFWMTPLSAGYLTLQLDLIHARMQTQTVRWSVGKSERGMRRK